MRRSIRANRRRRGLDCGDGREDGAGLIDWPWSGGANPNGTTITFSCPVHSVAIRAGDFLVDADGPLTLAAYDCNERPVASTSAPWSAGATGPFHWLEVRATEICRVDYHSAGDDPGSTFIAAVRFDASIEPSHAAPRSGVRAHSPGAEPTGAIVSSDTGGARRAATR